VTERKADDPFFTRCTHEKPEIFSKNVQKTPCKMQHNVVLYFSKLRTQWTYALVSHRDVAAAEAVEGKKQDLLEEKQWQSYL